MSWQQLDSILKEQAREADFYRQQLPSACPNDGEPLRPGPPERGVVLYCPFDGFQYPRDWNPDTMGGM